MEVSTMASNWSGMDEEGPPVHLFSDYIQMVFLAVVLLVGVPSNCVVLCRLLSLYSTSSKDSVKAGFVLLKLTMSTSDLLLLLIIAGGKLLWLATYEWKGGDLLCRVYNYLQMAAFYKSSNIIVCIALDRLRTVLGAAKIRRGRDTVRSVRILLSFSWTLALLWATPQLVVWRAVNVFPHSNTPWVQCTDIWIIDRDVRREGEPAPAPLWLLNETFHVAYNIFHLVFVFWGPLVVLFVSYAIIAMRLARFSLQAGPQPSTTRMAERQSSILLDGPSTKSTVLEEDAPKVERKPRSMSSPHFVSHLNHNRKANKKLSQVHAKNAVIQPLWRRRLRGKLFRSTLLIVAAHFILWFPYNFQALVIYVHKDFAVLVSDHVNIFQDLQLMITLVNPFLYAFAQ